VIGAEYALIRKWSYRLREVKFNLVSDKVAIHIADLTDND
jgi:hypothetical protein